MSMIDVIVSHVDGYRWDRWHAARNGDQPDNDARAGAASAPSVQGTWGVRDEVADSRRRAECDRLFRRLDATDLPREDRDRLGLFIRHAAGLVSRQDWDEFIQRMQQLIGLKEALTHDLILGDALDNVDELDGPEGG